MAIMLTKAVSAKNEAPGNAIATVTKSGNIKVVNRSILAVDDNGIDRLNAWYNGRIAFFPTYYG